MVNKKFELYKIRREVRRSGEQYDFFKNESNEFGSPTGEPVFVCSLNGIYHEENSHIFLTTGETTQYRSKKIPNILCEYSEVKEIKVGMYTKINNKKYNVTGVTNIQEWNLIADISLELVDNVSGI